MRSGLTKRDVAPEGVVRHSDVMTLIRTERRGAIELWTLDRPDRLNALPDPEDGEAFAAAGPTVIEIVAERVAPSALPVR